MNNNGIKPHGVKVYKGAIVIPIIGSDGEIVSLQFISGDGIKRFLAGGMVMGGFFTISGDENKILCEGFAMAAIIAEATGTTVASEE